VARLSSSGSARHLRRELFPLGFSGEVMLHIVDTWRDFLLNHQIKRETRITAVFRDALIAAYVAAGRSWFITLEDPITDVDFGTELGRNDLRFYPQNHHGQTIFFTVECKRLRVATSTGISQLADKYVEEGVQRFVDGRYSSGLPCGGMVGYVMDNEMSKAMASVLGAIRPRQKTVRLRAKSLRTPSSVLPNYKWSADTGHILNAADFTLHHVLLGVAQ
jgi:hypothetical protein